MRPRARDATLAGAVLAAVAASSCCIGPLVVAALGIGGAGAFAALAAYRPYVLGATASLLALGFHLTYRAPRAADACGCQRPRANRAGRIGLWLATALVAGLAASPTLLAAISARRPVPAAAGAELSHAVLLVRGVDCQACAMPIRRALTNVGGLHDVTLDVSARTVGVTYEPARGRLDAYVAAIDALGYEASLESSF